MGLTSGPYFIASHSLDSFIGLSPLGDRPNRVAVLSKGVEAPKWYIEALPGGNYILKIDRILHAVEFGVNDPRVKNLLFAVASDSIGNAIWRIEEDPENRRDLYTIKLANRVSDAWVAPIDSADKIQQITVMPIPSDHTSSAIFSIKSARG